MAATSSFVQKLGSAVMEVAAKKSSSWWYTPHMAAAARAISERIPMVDLVLEVRDARIPLSSEYEHLKHYPSRQSIVLLNKMDLASKAQMKDWMIHFDKQNCISFGVNSHNKESIKEHSLDGSSLLQLLNFLQARVKQLRKSDCSSNTVTLMLVGIPNVGKSALANSLHQVGRISAAEKGKLKHALVSPQPGETKDISSLKIASHPNIYVLDTPGVLPPQIFDAEICSKLALTELARYFLAILNLGEECQKWAKLCTTETSREAVGHNGEYSGAFELHKRLRRPSPTDHTQDFIVNDVRRTLFETVSSLRGKLKDEDDLMSLIRVQFDALQEAFRLTGEASGGDAHSKVAAKIINLFRTGRLGHYTLDHFPTSPK